MNPPPSLRALLVRVAVAAVLPSALALFGLAVWPYLQERDHAAEGLTVSARLLSASLDERLLRVQRQLVEIAHAIPLDNPQAFHDTALKLRDAEQIDALILVAPDGTHALNTRFPAGSSLPRSSPAMLTGAIRRGMPVINDLYMAPVLEHPAVGVGIPVIEGQQIRFALNGAIEASRIRDVLLRHDFPKEWTATVVDRNGYVIAHSRDHGLHIGSKAGELPEGAGEVLRDGMLTASAVSPTTGWTVLMEVPQERLFAPMQQRLLTVAVALVLLVSVILLAIGQLHATILKAVEGLMHFVRQTRHGEDVDPPPLGFREADEFARALKASDRQLQRAEVELATTQRRLAGVVETAMDAIVTIDEDQKVVMFNRAAQEMFGMRQEDVLGQPIHLLVPERHRGEHPRAVDEFGSRSSHAREMGGDRVVHGRHASGAEFPVDASISSMTDEDGRRWMTVILRDVTQREREREALVRSNLELQQFAFVASHDLRSPMRTIDGYLELVAAAEPALQPRSRELLQRAKAAVRQLDELTTSLLSYARLSEGKAFEPVDMNAAAADALSLLQATVSETGAQVMVHDLPPVHGDRTQLVQLLQNLLGNAMKYSGRQPRIELSAEAGEAGWTFSVRDNGIGIEPRYLRKIFEPFKRLHTQAEYGGTGIGLAICKRVVERHGGSIWATSQPGEGSAFFFTIAHPKKDPE